MVFAMVYFALTTVMSKPSLLPLLNALQPPVMLPNVLCVSLSKYQEVVLQNFVDSP